MAISDIGKNAREVLTRRYLGKDENGKRIRKTVLGDSPEEVEEKMQKLRYDIYSGKFVDA